MSCTTIPNPPNLPNIPKFKTLEIGLTSICNLKCPLCTRAKKIFKDTENYPKYKTNELDLGKLIEAIRIINPEEVKLVGAVGEPTLYSGFLELVSWLYLKDIKVWLSTNGSTHSPKWWSELSTILPVNSTINIDIDHTDRDKQQTYRIKSNLDLIKSNVQALTLVPNRKYQVRAQRIQFDWNESNREEYYLQMPLLGFDDIFEIPCYDFNPQEFSVDLGYLNHPKINDYKLFRKTQNKKQPVKCEAKEHQSIYLNYLGEIMPCCYINDEYLKEEERRPNIYDTPTEELLTMYTNKVNNPLSTEHSEVCDKFCNVLGKKFCKMYKLDP